MRAMLILISAVILGLAGGYGWSAMVARPARAAALPKREYAIAPDLPQSASDRQWAARAANHDTPSVEADRPDPTAVEQSVTYSGCDEVRAAGKAPLHAGDPGYRPEMDGDGDGIACEPRRATR
jgi:hypothetical protein